MLHLYNWHESLNISSWWGLGLSFLVHADMLKPAQVLWVTCWTLQAEVLFMEALL